MRAALATLLTLGLLAALSPAAARADGDPPSDVLLSQDVYFPYPPNGVSKPLQKALADTLARSKAAGFEVKVALVAAQGDLGSVANLFSDPQAYANLLTDELRLNVTHGRALKGPRILAVLPGGLGGNNLGDNAGTALGDLLPKEEEGADGLARTAAEAVNRLAEADGKPFTMPPLPAASAGGGNHGGGGGGGGAPFLLIVGAPVLVMLLLGAAVNLVLKRKDDEPAPTHPS